VLTYESSVVVDRPPEIVYPYLAEPALQAHWSDVPMRQLTPGPFATGTRIEVTFGKRPLSATLGLELTALEPERRMAWTTFNGPIRWDGEYRVSPSGDGGTRLEQEGRLRFTGLWRLLEPLVAGEIRSGEVKELEKLKAVVEAT